MKISKRYNANKMSEKLLLHSIRIFKLSAWVGGGLAVFIVFVVMALIMFPVLIKEPLEAQLSALSNLDIKISKPYISIKNGDISLQIDRLEATTVQKNLVVVADNLRLELHLYSILNDIASLGRIYIDTLTLDLNVNTSKSQNKFSIEQIQYLSALPNSEIFNFFNILNINKTIIKNKQNIEIAPILITSNDKQLMLKIIGFSLNSNVSELNENKVNITIAIPSVQPKNVMLSLPVSISNKDLSMITSIKFQINDIDQQDLDVKVTGKIDTHGKHLIEFIKLVPLNKSVHKMLNQFNLSGKVDGDMHLIMSLDERKPILDIDLMLKDIRLTTLDGVALVENYNSKLTFHNNEITTTGVGDIRGMQFGARINSNNISNDNDHERTFLVELINNSSNFKAYITKRLDQSWYTKVESELVNGSVVVSMNEDGIMDVELLNMQVIALDTIKSDWKITPKDLPSIRLNTTNVRINKYVLPNFSVELFSNNGTFFINNLQLKGVGVNKKEIDVQGYWDGKKIQFNAKIKGKNLIEFLQQLKIKEKISGEEFNFGINLICDCAPWNINYQDITGYFDINIKEGVFTDKENNIGRILSLLNIKSIAKRLNLNFSDVTSKGLVYENIEAQLHLQNKIIKIENFNLKASSSDIVLTGQSNISDKQYDLTAKVTPTINDAVPIATYLAGGGLIGLGMWALDKTLFDGNLINKTLNKIIMFEYKITGPWDGPIIKEQ